MMYKNSSSHFNNQQIVLASNNPAMEHVQSSQQMKTAGRFSAQQNSMKQRNNSTEATRQIFDAATGIMRQRNSNQQNITSANNNQTFHTSAEHSVFKTAQNRGHSNGHAMSNSHYGQGGQPSLQLTEDKSSEKQSQVMMPNRQEIVSPATNLSTQAGEYQSILLTRYLKEPRLPPSSTYYNAQRKKSKPTASRGTAKPQLTQKGHSFVNQMTGGAENQTFLKESTSPSKNNGFMAANNYLDSRKSRKRMLPIGSAGAHKPNEISYRNQNEIMRKIFGNEQNYHQVKSLLVRGPYDEDRTQQTVNNAKQQQKSPLNQKVMNEYVQQQSQMKQGVSSPMNSKQKTFSANYDKRQSLNSHVTSSQINGNQSPMIGPEEIILAKSYKKNLDHPGLVTDSSTGISSQIRSDRPLPDMQSGNNDQVEKAIFDLQDVKNNYFQEKTLYEQKMQQIQIKQQNQTMSNGFGAFPNGTAYNRTATAGFLGSAGNQRPLTQGGMILKNQQLMNDNNVLKGDLEQVSKEDLKERLVVAEMVMKKLFQRNKDLEDQVVAQAAAAQEKSFDTMDQDDQDLKSINELPNHKRLSHSLVGSPKNLADLENNDITTIAGLQNECASCVQLRKEIIQKEKDMQDRFNELQQQILKKTEGITKSTHIEYLQLRLEETMAEAKRHFSNYISARNNYNQFLESRLNLGAYQGGTKGQKIQADILNMLKKNLESSEQVLVSERDQLKLGFAKTQAQLLKKDHAMKKRDKQIKELQDEIERRKFIEGKVQRYVKGLISQNQRHTEFLDRLLNNSQMGSSKRLIEEFKKDMERSVTVGAQDGGESTENEDDEEEIERRSGTVDEEDDRNISVEVNDL